MRHVNFAMRRVNFGVVTRLDLTGRSSTPRHCCSTPASLEYWIGGTSHAWIASKIRDFA